MVVAAEAPDFQFVIDGVIPDVAPNVTVGKSVVACPVGVGRLVMPIVSA